MTEKYVLSTGEAGAERLRLVNEIFGPGTERLLRTAGLAPGMRVAEIGCGTGLVSLWIAGVAGANGSVTSADASAEQLGVAEHSSYFGSWCFDGGRSRMHLPRDAIDRKRRYYPANVGQSDAGLGEKVGPTST